MEELIDQSYQLIKKIGSGAFGEIFEGINIHTGIQVAIKLEPTNSKHPQLKQERQVYDSLWQYQQTCGIPRIYDSGTWSMNDNMYNYIIIDLLGPSLEDVFKLCGRKFTLKTVLTIADEILSRIEYIHFCKILHRDIDPSNFLIGIGNQYNLCKTRANKIYIIDFGMAQSYIDGKHIECQSGTKLMGTSRFPSINAHSGIQQGRRDDLESLGYMLLYFLNGSLPWQNIKVEDQKGKYNQILEIKTSITIETLCQGLPQEFSTYLYYVKNLKLEEMPNYQYLRNLFKDLFIKSSFQNDYVCDWNLVQKEKIEVASPNTYLKTQS